MRNILLLICIAFAITSCKESDPTSLLWNEYVNEFMEPGMSGVDDNYDWEKHLKPWLPVYEGYYTVSEEYVKTEHSLQSSVKVYQTLTFEKSDCSIRNFRDIKAHVGYSNDKMVIYKFREGSFEKTQYNPFLEEEVKFIFYVRPDGLYNQATYLNGSKEESKLFPLNDFERKFISQKGAISDYEDLTYTTDSTENFTYTQTGNEILMINDKRQIKGIVSSDYKTIVLTQTSPDVKELGTFNYK